jgi:D-glycero-alpha-D-manno-heptose 1-phosphate guanylyltransferase
LPDLPKPLAPIAGRPFLEWQLRFLRKQAIFRIAISTGYQASRIDALIGHIGLANLHISCVSEARPLGTAGGFVNAFHSAGACAKQVLVCNGDSLVLTPFEPLFDAAETADAAMLAVTVEDASRFGTLKVEGARLLGFEEKRPGAGLINAGVYIFRRETIARFPSKRPLSFEYDVFPALLSDGARIAVVACQAPFIDIGTEESLAQAEAFIRQHMSWFE